MKTFFFMLLISANTFAITPVGYWAKYSITTISENGSKVKKTQLKEMIKADEELSEYTIKVTETSADGKISVSQHIEDYFLSPEDGLDIVTNCVESGGEIVARSLDNKTVKTCHVIEGENEFSFAAVPFGYFQSVRPNINQVLKAFGKR
jgi:hypothetical protein